MHIVVRAIFSNEFLLARRLVSTRLLPVASLYRCARLYQIDKSNATESSEKNHVPSTAKETKGETLSTTRVVAKKMNNWILFAFFAGGIFLLGSVAAELYGELFGSSSIYKIQDKVFKLCKDDPRVQRFVGTPMSSLGAEMSNRRGRSRPSVRENFDPEGNITMRMTFKLSGPNGTATCVTEVQNYRKENIITKIVVRQDAQPQDVVVLL